MTTAFKSASYMDILYPITAEMASLKCELMAELKMEAYEQACRDLKMEYRLEGVGSSEEYRLRREVDSLNARLVRAEQMRRLVEDQLTEARMPSDAPTVEFEPITPAKQGSAATFNLEGIPWPSSDEEADLSSKIRDVLAQHGVTAKIKKRIVGPTTVRYLIKLKGSKVSEFMRLSDELTLELGDVRVLGAMPGTGCVGVEVTRTNRQIVPLSRTEGHPLDVTLGHGVEGEPYTINLGKLPHLLVAGATGGGKSGLVNTILCSLLYVSPDDVQFGLIDMKRVELAPYRDAPHLWRDIADSADKAVQLLSDVCDLMEERYDAMQKAGHRSFDSYRETSGDPYLVVVADEIAELMMADRKRVEPLLQRLAQLGRAAGIHVVAATQRPSVDVVTGPIKANFPARIAFQTVSSADSRVILDVNGAEKLAGAGDGLMLAGSSIDRFQSAWVDDATIRAIVESTK